MDATSTTPLYQTPLALASPCELSGQDLIRTAATRARPLVSGSCDAAEGYEIPLPTSTLARRRQPRARCSEDGGAAPLAVYAFLVIVSIAAAAWNSWMAMNNAQAAEKLREEAAARCERLAPSDRRTHAAAVRHVGSIGGSACVIGAAELLQQASQVGRETTSTNSPGTSQQQLMAYAGASRPNGQKGDARSLAHLGSAFYPSPEPDLAYPHVDRWLDDRRFGSVVTGNLSNADGGVTIGESGLYFVYSQVGYVLAARDAVEVSPYTDHKLMRRRAGQDRGGGSGSVERDLLARAQKTRCWSAKSNCSMTSSYVGAVFRLDKGDVVTVDVDRVRYVWHSPQQTYIGAYLLSS